MVLIMLKSLSTKKPELNILVWEREIFNNVIRAMESYPGAVFLDIGANIGMYTVVIAAMRRRVIAVDADPSNLAYIRQSLQIENTTDYVEIIYNSIRYQMIISTPTLINDQDYSFTIQ